MPDVSQFESYARILKLHPVMDAPATVQPAAPAAEPQRAGVRPRNWLSFALMVVLPVSLMAIYFWFFSADRYVSEAQFVLRTPARNMLGNMIPGLFQATGVSRSNDDGYIVQAFLESRDAMQVLEAHGLLRRTYDKAKLDFIWNFPNPFMPNNGEGLYRQFRRLTSATYDDTTGVTVLRMQAFSPEDAQQLSNGLLDAAEGLVNKLNERARRDTIALSEEEASRTRDRAIAAQSALTRFRERERLIDPSQVTYAVLESIVKLSHEAAQTSVQISEISKITPGAPQAQQLRARRSALEAQIEVERARLAGDATSIAPRIAEYERLMIEREFAEKALIAAMAALEAAKAEAHRQNIYLERVASPSKPDYPTYPWKFVWCLVTLVVCYMTWRMMRIVTIDALRHNRD